MKGFLSTTKEKQIDERYIISNDNRKNILSLSNFQSKSHQPDLIIHL